jgi:ABC-type transport system involved in multi-copper enzyme maturation permease subunit
MKFLAILKDSLREAIDAKVFYVMAGLSVLLTLVAFTLTFTPTASGERVMQMAAVPLNLSDEDLAEMTGDQQKFTQRIMRQTVEGKRRIAYILVSAKPVGGAPDAPASPFKVVLSATFLFSDDAKKAQADPQEAIDHIRTRFGAFDKLKIVEAAEVRQVDRPGDAKDDGPGLPFVSKSGKMYFEVTTRPTSATARFWSHEMSLLFGAIPVGGENAAIPLFMWIYIIEAGIVASVGAWVTILVSIILTSFFIPNMLRKGTVDMLVVKPIHRVTLLVYKYIGGLTFMFLNTTVAIGGVWLALGLRAGQWPTGFLVMIFVLTFFFAILYSVSTLAGVLTQSPIVAILMACGAWLLLFLVGLGYNIFEDFRAQDEAARRQEKAEKELKDADVAPAPDSMDGPGPGVRAFRNDYYQNWFAKTVYAVHFVLPRTADIDKLSDQLLLRDLTFASLAGEKKQSSAPVAWGESISVSLGFIAVMLGLACWRFATKDY